MGNISEEKKYIIRLNLTERGKFTSWNAKTYKIYTPLRAEVLYTELGGVLGQVPELIPIPKAGTSPVFFFFHFSVNSFPVGVSGITVIVCS